MKTRVIIGAATSLFLVAALTGCSTNGGQSDADSNTIRLFGNTNNTEAINQIIDAFMEDHPDAKIVTEFYGVSDGQAALNTQLSAGTGADIIQIYTGAGSSNSALVLAENGYLADLSDREFASDFAGDSEIVYDDKLVAVPQTVQGIGYLYSEQVMEAAGLTPPKTWSEVKPFCEAARAAGKTAYAAAWQTGWPALQLPYALTATSVYGTDPDFTEQQYDGKKSFVDSGWLDALEKMQDMQSWSCFQDAPNGTTYDQVIAMLASGEALGSVLLPTALPALKPAAPEGTVWNLAAVPATDDPEETMLPSSNLVAFGQNAKSANNKLAAEFMDFLATPEAIAIQANNSGGIPTLPSADWAPAQPAIQTVVDYRDAGQTTQWPDHSWRNPKVLQDLISGVQGIFAGTATPDSTLEQMNATLLR